MLKSPTSKFGKIGEDYAVRLLQDKGYEILERNFHSKFGELDIVALDGDTLVFAEVKARRSNKFGFPEEAVTTAKLWKIKKTGEFYVLMHSGLPKKLRVDVVALQIEGGQVISEKIIKVDT